MWYTAITRLGHYHDLSGTTAKECTVKQHRLKNAFIVFKRDNTEFVTEEDINFCSLGHIPFFFFSPVRISGPFTSGKSTVEDELYWFADADADGKEETKVTRKL